MTAFPPYLPQFCLSPLKIPTNNPDNKGKAIVISNKDFQAQESKAFES